jgi:hypothetical protein
MGMFHLINSLDANRNLWLILLVILFIFSQKYFKMFFKKKRKRFNLEME